MKQYLISLVDSDSIYFKLVDSNVWNWIMSGTGNEKFDGLLFGTINDRANVAPGLNFAVEKEIDEYIEANKIEIVQGFQAIFA